MTRNVALGLAFAVGLLWVGEAAFAQAKPKSKADEPKLDSQKAVMKEMSDCYKKMQALSGSIEKDKRGAVALRKDLGAQADRMAKLTEAWKPFIKKDKAKLADDLLTASNNMTEAAKPTAKKGEVTDAMTGVQKICAECHKAYKPKESSDQKKDTGTK